MRLLLVALCVVAFARDVQAGAWTLERGETKAFVTSTFTYGDHGFDRNGRLVTVPDYQKFALSAALEYGLRPWLTAIVRGEMSEERADDPALAAVYIEPPPKTFGAAGGGARVRLFQGPLWVASAQVLAMSGGFTTTGVGASADGPSVEVRALAGTGRTVLGHHAFVDGQVAYRARFGEAEQDEIKLDLTLGVQVRPKWLVLGQTFSTFAVTGGREASSYHKLSASVVRDITDRLQVQVSGIATVAGRNAVRELGGSVGFWWTLPKPASTREEDNDIFLPGFLR